MAQRPALWNGGGIGLIGARLFCSRRRALMREKDKRGDDLRYVNL
jgi:hypothetical protein